MAYTASKVKNGVLFNAKIKLPFVVAKIYPNQIAFRFFVLFFFPLSALKNETVTTAMLEFFASLKEKITYPKFPKSYLIRVYVSASLMFS